MEIKSLGIQQSFKLHELFRKNARKNKPVKLESVQVKQDFRQEVKKESARHFPA